MLPLADRFPDAVKRVRQDIVVARFIGKLAVDQGVRELRARLAPSEPVPETPAPDRDAGGSADLDPNTDDTALVPPVSTLALVDYDELPASDIVALLGGLDPDERDAIRIYERANRRRRTILGKLDQLAAG